MIGMNPYTGRPLNLGVSVHIAFGGCSAYCDFHETEAFPLFPIPTHVVCIQVTLNIDVDCVRREADNVYIAVKGDRRFQVQGEPWLDDSESFYLAEIEIIEHREENLSDDEKVEAGRLSDAIPELVDRWLGWIIQTGKSDQAGMDSRMKDIGPMPTEVGKRAIWAAALVNPLPALGVCLEIRPAMLACKNDLDRIKLAVAAIQSSTDHLSGKRRLF